MFSPCKDVLASFAGKNNVLQDKKHLQKEVIMKLRVIHVNTMIDYFPKYFLNYSSFFCCCCFIFQYEPAPKECSEAMSAARKRLKELDKSQKK